MSEYDLAEAWTLPLHRELGDDAPDFVRQERFFNHGTAGLRDELPKTRSERM